MVSVALLGNPNSGKTSIFNQLTGLRQKVGNFPGVTVEKKEGIFFLPSGTKVRITDLPGTYSLYPNSFEERIVVDTLTDVGQANYPDLIVYVVDVTNIERHTLLLTQVRELGIPVVLVLNMSDIADREGIFIDTAQLERVLQTPVVMASGRSGKGIKEIVVQIEGLLQKERLAIKPFHEFSAVEKRVADFVQHRLHLTHPYIALLIAHHHTWLSHLDEETRSEIADFIEEQHFESLKLQIHETMGRYDRFSPLLKSSITNSGQEHTITNKIDNWVTHPLLGPLIFIALLFFMFQAIFAWASWPMELIEQIFQQASHFTRQVLPAQAWYTRLLTEGVLAGLAGIAVFIPQIAILFFLISILEEVGYMARAVFIFDRLMQQFGLNGRSVVALVSGGACAIPAVMSARTISSWKERLITILVTPLISCSARIPIYVIIIALIVPFKSYYGIVNSQGLVFAALYVIGVVAALGAAWLFHKILKTEERSYLLIEMPTYKMPHLRNVLYNVGQKTWTFVKEAGKVIFFISIILWFLASYGPPESMQAAAEKAERISAQQHLQPSENALLTKSLKLEASYAGYIGKAIEPTIEPLGYDWKIGIALLTSFAAREVFVGTIATIYSIGEDAEETTIVERLRRERDPNTGQPVFDVATGWSLLIFYVFAMQCMSTLAVVRKETGTWKWPMIQLVFMTVLAYVSALLVYQLLQ